MPDPQCLTLRAPADPATDRLRSAIERIASAGPCVLDPGQPTERRCCMCAALIDEARRALEEP